MSQPPLYVDLDECLIHTDLLAEGIFAVLKSNPLDAFRLLYWLLLGRARLKLEVARRHAVDAAHLPYNQPFLEFLRAERARGRSLVLATSANEAVAEAVAGHLGLFDAAIASDGTDNTKGARKRRAIESHSCGGAFDYAGDSRADLDVWTGARRAFVVNARPRVERAARRLGNVERVFERHTPRIADYLRQLRWHQWFKNTLLFIPILGAHAWTDSAAILAATIGFISFSFCASATYVFNDIFDISADRRHPRKRYRPLAAGRISIGRAVAVAVSLLAIGVALAANLGLQFLGCTVAYLVATIAYSVHLKALVLVDAVTLAGLYTLRVIAGGAAAGIPISFWLLALSIFLFFSLALVKRWSELHSLAARGELSPRGRDYRVSDLPLIGAMGVASGYIAVAVLALYIQSPEVSLRYARPEFLWVTCLIMLYWISRMWIKTGRGEMDDDPLVYTLRDRASRILMLVGALAVLAATFAG